jgi:hypothetical protein
MDDSNFRHWAGALGQPRRSPYELNDVQPGIYALMLRPDSRLLQVPLGSERIVYVGCALKAEGIRIHFEDGGSCRSSLRRSLGALLRQELRLQVRPRMPVRDAQDWINYRFDTEGEKRLTHWMRRHLSVAHLGLPEGTDANAEIDGALLRQFDPPLNLSGTSSPFRRLLVELRSACRDDARAWALERQLPAQATHAGHGTAASGSDRGIRGGALTS